MALLDPLFGSAAMGEVFSDAARIQRMLDFEAALARAEARCGVIPAAAAPAIAAKCKVELIDANALATATATSLNPAIPLVKQLTALVAKDDDPVFCERGTWPWTRTALAENEHVRVVPCGGVKAAAAAKLQPGP